MIESKKLWVDLVEKAKKNLLSDQQIADLAVEYASSGKREAFSDLPTADVASTGGPSSLSTLLTPLFLVRSGYVVPKLGVPGRPAGGLDVLAQIPGYRIELSEADLVKTLADCGYAHFISAGAYAPLDFEIFRLRQRLDAQAVPALVIASLLSKKIAVDVKNIGLDVRIAAHGNFGQDYFGGRANAKRFNRVAELLDRQAVCILTDATAPYQPYIGRGEALWALSRYFSDDGDSWLMQHVRQCAAMAVAVGGNECELQPPHMLRQVFEANLRAQGTDFDTFCDVVEKIKNGHRYVVEAPRSGFIAYDLGKLRATIMSVQQRFLEKQAYPDPSGVRLLVELDRAVDAGQPVISVRIPNDLWEEYNIQIRESFRITEQCELRKEDEIVNDR